jgi:hypothetical protein
MVSNLKNPVYYRSYDNNEMDMNGIFYAFGPDFKIGYILRGK